MAATLAVFPSVPLTPENPHGKVEQVPSCQIMILNSTSASYPPSLSIPPSSHLGCNLDDQIFAYYHRSCHDYCGSSESCSSSFRCVSLSLNPKII